MKGMVRRVGGGIYTVALESGEIVEASLRGRLKLEERTGDQVVIGDRVRVELIDDEAHVIEEVFPRETAITRSRFGGRTIKVLVANADRLLVVVAAAQPKPRRDLIDRLLVVGESGGVTPVIIINKMDFDGAADVADGLEEVYLPLGYEVLRISALLSQGMDRLAEQLCEGIAALAGPSGVGKSSLVNALEPEHALRTGELSRKHGTGRHTTVSSSLIQLRCGGLVADTPGFSDVGVWGVPREELDGCFPELRALKASCRFRECSHLHEPDCAVRQALEEGAIDPGRFESYRILYEESAA
ncbi:MAG: ribosome small subunit-dependent GTPase A [Gemmatimonadetes bacterium]|nr:ribosome small subunit-dependent GTPase A [Gemmatimonadota bacterium]